MSQAPSEPPATQQEAEQNQAADSGQEQQKIKNITLTVTAVCVLLFAWYLAADRITPSTSQARVSAFVIPITPEVSGSVVDIAVDNNSLVRRDQRLVTIDPERYQLAVAQAEAELELAGQDAGADVEAVSAAQSKVIDARATLQHAEAQARRVLSLTEKGIMAESFGDQAKAAIVKSRAALEKAEADLRAAKRRMGQQGLENSKIQSALAKLRQARLDLNNTTIQAPHNGVVTNLQIELGHFAQQGAPLMTFLSADQVWIEAYMRENNLERIQAGNKVEFVLDAAPGRVFEGVVSSVGYGVDWGKKDQIGQLQTIESQTGWLRSAQRMPVLIEFPTEQTKGLLRMGGQVDVIVYTGDNWLMNGIGKLWVRLISLLSYAY